MKEVLKEDPGIPIFIGLTVVALGAGMRQSFIVQDPSKANQYMFMRVLFQGLAAASVGYSIFKMGSRDQERMDDMKKKVEAAKQHE